MVSKSYAAAFAVFFSCRAFGAFFDGDWVEGYDLTPPQTGKSVPAVNQPFSDDVYGATIRRISAPNEVSPGWVRHEYSRRQAFNADSSRLIMFGSNGAWQLYNVAADDSVIFDRKLPSMSEPNWHPTDPDRFRFFPRNGGLEILEYDISAGTSTVVADFTGRLPWSNIEHIWTKEEGEPSADGRIWCLMAEDAGFTTQGIFAYDIEADRILGSAGLSSDPDHISTAPSGEFCVPSGTTIGGTWAYSTDFGQSRLIHDRSEHSDLAIGADGADLLVFADYLSGWITMANLATGAKTQLIKIYEITGSGYALHLSGNNYGLPGFVVLSTYGATLDYGKTPADYGDIWGHDRLAVIELVSDPRVFNIAYMHAGRAGYFSEPQASVNHDLTRILFASTWEQTEELAVATYMVTLGDGGDEGLSPIPETGDLIFGQGFEQ